MMHSVLCRVSDPGTIEDDLPVLIPSCGRSSLSMLDCILRLLLEKLIIVYTLILCSGWWESLQCHIRRLRNPLSEGLAMSDACRSLHHPPPSPALGKDSRRIRSNGPVIHGNVGVENGKCVLDLPISGS